MKNPIYNLKGRVWVYAGPAAWHFVTLPKAKSKEIERLYGGLLKRGWGSVPVRVTVGNTGWNTSIFPDRKVGAYLLPLKASVRQKEGIASNKMLSYSLEIKV